MTLHQLPIPPSEVNTGVDNSLPVLIPDSMEADIEDSQDVHIAPDISAQGHLPTVLEDVGRAPLPAIRQLASSTKPPIRTMKHAALKTTAPTLKTTPKKTTLSHSPASSPSIGARGSSSLSSTD